MKKKGLYFLALLLIFLTGCDGSDYSKKFWIDNPTSSTITVSVDDKNYEIPANSGIVVEISWGKHTLGYSGETINIVVKPNDQGCIINPTLSRYVFYNEIYVVEGREDEAKAEYEKNKKDYLYPFVLASNDTIFVPFKSIENTLFIEQYQYYWHFGVTESYEDVRLNMGNTNLATVNRSKIFREKDFVSYVGAENLPDEFKLESSSYKLRDLPVYEFIPSDVIEVCPLMKDDLMSLKNEFDALATIMDLEQFKAQTSYKLSNKLGDIWRNSLDLKSENNSVCDKSIKLLTTRKPSLGDMNAYIIK